MFSENGTFMDFPFGSIWHFPESAVVVVDSLAISSLTVKISAVAFTQEFTTNSFGTYQAFFHMSSILLILCLIFTAAFIPETAGKTWLRPTESTPLREDIKASHGTITDGSTTNDGNIWQPACWLDVYLMWSEWSEWREKCLSIFAPSALILHSSLKLYAPADSDEFEGLNTLTLEGLTRLARAQKISGKFRIIMDYHMSQNIKFCRSRIIRSQER